MNTIKSKLKFHKQKTPKLFQPLYFKHVFFKEPSKPIGKQKGPRLGPPQAVLIACHHRVAVAPGPCFARHSWRSNLLPLFRRKIFIFKSKNLWVLTWLTLFFSVKPEVVSKLNWNTVEQYNVNTCWLQNYVLFPTEMKLGNKKHLMSCQSAQRNNYPEVWSSCHYNANQNKAKQKHHKSSKHP